MKSAHVYLKKFFIHFTRKMINFNHYNSELALSLPNLTAVLRNPLATSPLGCFVKLEQFPAVPTVR